MKKVVFDFLIPDSYRYFMFKYDGGLFEEHYLNKCLEESLIIR